MNKKGFTLIELLSVIVVLAIIIVIAVPSVLRIQENIRKNSITSSALLFYKSVDLCISTETDYTKCNTNTVLTKYYEGTLNDVDLIVDENGNITTFKYSNPSTGYGIALNKSKITKEDISKAEVMNTKSILDYNIVDNNTIKFNSIYNTTFNKFQIKGNVDGVGNITNNLFNKNNLQSGYINDVNGNFVTADYYKASDYINVYNLEKVYIEYSGSSAMWGAIYDVNHNYISGIVGYNRVVTIPSNGYYIRITSLPDCIDNLQVIPGSIPTEYEPYGKYKIPITITGKNLFDKSTANLNTTLVWLSGQIFNETNSFGSDYIPVRYNQNYIFSRNVSAVMAYDSNKNYIGSLQNSGTTWLPQTGNASIKNFSINNINIKYIKFTIRNLSDINNTIDTLFLEKGNVSTSYEPYVEPITTTIYLDKPLKTNGEYIDYIDFQEKTVTYYDENGIATTKNIDLPTIPIYNGTTIVTIDTTNSANIVLK